MKYKSLWLLAGLLAACTTPQSEEDNKSTAALPEVATHDVESTMLAPMQRAHGAEALANQEVIKSEITLYRGQDAALAAIMYVSTEGAKVRMELPGGSILVFDGKECWTNDSTAATSRNRFHLLTWSYFLMAPYKVADPGTHFEVLGEQEMRKEEMAMAGRLTFDAGIGDSPDDWYILYTDPQTHLLRAVSYIVTYASPAEEAEPHAMVYEDYQPVAGVQIPTKWSLFGWSEAEGIGESLNTTVTLTDVAFVQAESLFEAPAKGYKLPLPGEG